MEGDDYLFVGWVVLVGGLFVDYFDCYFVGFGVGIVQEYVFGEVVGFYQFFGQVQWWCIVEYVVGVLEFVGLFDKCGYQVWIIVVQVVYGDVGGQVDEFMFLVVLYVGVLFLFQYYLVGFVDWQVVV